jgi:hypothetical protein
MCFDCTSKCVFSTEVDMRKACRIKNPESRVQTLNFPHPSTNSKLHQPSISMKKIPN